MLYRHWTTDPKSEFVGARLSGVVDSQQIDRIGRGEVVGCCGQPIHRPNWSGRGCRVLWTADAKSEVVGARLSDVVLEVRKIMHKDF
jgi:hypothetical protein